MWRNFSTWKLFSIEILQHGGAYGDVSRLLCSMGNLCPPHLVNAAGGHHCAAHLLSTTGGGFCPARWAGTVGGYLCPTQPAVALQEWIMGVAELLPSASAVALDRGVHRPDQSKSCFSWVEKEGEMARTCLHTCVQMATTGSFAQSCSTAIPTDTDPSFTLCFSHSLFFLPN